MTGTPASSLSIVRREDMAHFTRAIAGASVGGIRRGYRTGQAPVREYNCVILTTKLIMEAEKLNLLANSLADLGARAKEMRRYL